MGAWGRGSVDEGVRRSVGGVRSVDGGGVGAWGGVALESSIQNLKSKIVKNHRASLLKGKPLHNNGGRT